MKHSERINILKAGASVFGLMTTMMVLLAVSAAIVSTPADASYYRYYKAPQLSDALEANGFATLKYALDATGLTPVLDSNRVTVFAPTDDVFDATATALGCDDALELATNLINIPVGDSNALAVILTYHAALGVIKSNAKLLSDSPIQTVSTDEVTTGVNSDGLYVQGLANTDPSSITVEGIRGKKWVIYPIDTILLPFEPPADLCVSGT